MEHVLIITNTIIFFALLIGTYTDIRTREVPDWLNYGLIGIGFAIWALHWVIYSDAAYFLNGLFGFSAFFIFALIMFYTGQWGGGDSKMLMGLGVLIGLDIGIVTPLFGLNLGPVEFPFIVSFLINILLVGAAYGFLWSFFLAIKHWKPFFKELKKILKDKKLIKAKWAVLVLVVIGFALLFIIDDFMLKIMISGLILAVVSTLYLWAFVKAIEKTCMFRNVTPNELTEGDWIVKPVKVKGRVICGPKDLGIEKKQIALLKRYKVKSILIKEGIPFVPSFFIAYIASVYLLYRIPETAGNLILLFL